LTSLFPHTGLHITHTKWLVHSWSTFGARTSHEQHGHTRLTTARTWGKPPPSPLIIYSATLHGTHIQMAFLSRDSRDSRAGVSKSRPAGLPGLWSPITLQEDVGSKCGLKQSCSSRRDLFNGMSHVVCSQVFRVDSRLLVVRSQNWQTPGSSTPGPSFGHNLCFRCPNEQCEPILNIYASRAFHCYKERHKSLRFDPSNRSLKFRESTETPISQSGSCLGSVRVPSLTLSYTPGSPWCDSRASLWPAPLQPLCLGREPKARVATPKLLYGLNCESKGEDNKRRRSWGELPGS
jgi:hypothetical protein